VINLDELEALLAKATPDDIAVADADFALRTGGPDTAALIVAAVNALPELIAEVRLLRQRDADRPSITQEP
jgi:hypothetical protein